MHYRQLPARIQESAPAYSKGVQLARQQLGLNPTDANVRSKIGALSCTFGQTSGNPSMKSWCLAIEGKQCEYSV